MCAKFCSTTLTNYKDELLTMCRPGSKKTGSPAEFAAVLALGHSHDGDVVVDGGLACLVLRLFTREAELVLQIEFRIGLRLLLPSRGTLPSLL
jgi:hypothetical protein